MTNPIKDSAGFSNFAQRVKKLVLITKTSALKERNDMDTIKIEHREEYIDGKRIVSNYYIKGIENEISYSLRLNEDSFNELCGKIKEYKEKLTLS